jgi:hypothetical protein
MPDPFTLCTAMRDGIHCWLVRDHRGLHETHPSDRLKSGGRVWQDDAPNGRAS